jgi:hypothetical protein
MQPRTNTPIRRLVTALILATALTSAACHAAPTGVNGDPTMIPDDGRPPGSTLDTVPRLMVVRADMPSVIFK